jgi:hypothetical protein
MESKNQETQNQNQTELKQSEQLEQVSSDAFQQGRENYFMDIDRMVNEGLGGGYVSVNNGLIEESTTDTMDHPESVIQSEE